MWWTRHWYTIFNGVSWLNARKLTADQAQDWYVTQLEAMGAHQPMSNILLRRWDGHSWRPG